MHAIVGIGEVSAPDILMTDPQFHGLILSRGRIHREPEVKAACIPYHITEFTHESRFADGRGSENRSVRVFRKSIVYKTVQSARKGRDHNRPLEQSLDTFITRYGNGRWGPDIVHYYSHLR
jgi:hypothetical protein